MRNASGKLLRALCEQNVLQRPHGALHTRSPGKPVRSEFNNFQPNFYPSAGLACIYHGRFRTGFHLCSRARGGLVRCTARTSCALLCESGAVTKTATAATQPLSLVWRRLHRNSTHALPRVMTLTHLAITLGHAVVVSHIPTAISLSYRALTHAVPLTHGASPIHAFSLMPCARFNTHFDTLVTITTHTGTITLGNRATTSAPGVSIPPSCACTR